MKFQIPSRQTLWARRPRRGFSLVELLVSIGVIAMLLGILLPVTVNVRREARLVKCQSNIRGLAVAMIAYAQDSKGRFPLNMTSPSPGLSWCDPDRIGRYVISPQRGDARETIFACPSDDGTRSYSMNFWASAKVDSYYLTPATSMCLWRQADEFTSQLILLAESWSWQGDEATGYFAPPTIGYLGATEGQRFGAAGGLTPIHAGRFGLINCELPYQRHRNKGSANGNQPHGRCTFAFADGHVESLSDDLLAEQATGLSSGRCMWYAGDKP